MLVVRATERRLLMDNFRRLLLNEDEVLKLNAKELNSTTTDIIGKFYIPVGLNIGGTFSLKFYPCDISGNIPDTFLYGDNQVWYKGTSNQFYLTTSLQSNFGWIYEIQFKFSDSSYSYYAIPLCYFLAVKNSYGILIPDYSTLEGLYIEYDCECLNHQYQYLKVYEYIQGNNNKPIYYIPA